MKEQEGREKKIFFYHLLKAEENWEEPNQII